MSPEQPLDYVKFVVRCAQECERWADECAAGDQAEAMRKSIWLCWECAKLCRTAAEALARGTKFVYKICESCIETCEACAAECGKYEYVNAERCAEACRQCAEELQQLAAVAV
jgi:hypothetical protein